MLTIGISSGMTMPRSVAAYINTGVKVSQNIRLEAEVYNPVLSSRHIVGARTAFRQNALGLSFQTEEPSVGFRAAYGSEIQSALTGLRTGVTRFALGGDVRVGVDRETVRWFDQQTFSSDLDIYVFTVNDNGNPHGQSSSVRLSSLTIRDGYDLVRDYMPAIDTNTLAVGFYDRVNGTFVTNVGTGTFRSGRIGIGFETEDLVANGSFESGTAVAPPGMTSDSGYASVTAAGTAGWTGNGYVTHASNAWIHVNRMLDGTYAVVLPDGASVEQTVAAKAGIYRLIYSQMAAGTEANTLCVTIDGVTVSEAAPRTKYGFVTENCDVRLRAGAHVLRFEGRGAGASCLDTVSLQLLRRTSSGTLMIVR